MDGGGGTRTRVGGEKENELVRGLDYVEEGLEKEEDKSLKNEKRTRQQDR